jgi:SAM-dependent methyltransferase
MNVNEYEEMYKLEAFYWWFVARRKLLRTLVSEVAARVKRPTILDVGCGTGINHSILSALGDAFSSDFSDEAVRFSKARGVDLLVRSRVESLPFATSSFDIITALDVLEHIDDDMAALAELRRITRDKGTLVITVPAYGFLWSEHDEALHHRRRYSASELRNKLTRAGFDVERVTYFITTLFFPILLVRFLSSFFKKSVEAKTSHIILPGWINSLLIRILDLERFLLRWINFPVGVSLVCLARKADRVGDQAVLRESWRPVPLMKERYDERPKPGVRAGPN